MNNKNLDKIEILIIDIFLLLFIALKNKNFISFFILLGFIKKVKKIIINFINKLLSYFLFIIDNILFNNIKFANINYNIIKTSLFIYIITK